MAIFLPSLDTRFSEGVRRFKGLFKLAVTHATEAELRRMVQRPVGLPGYRFMPAALPIVIDEP
jgi:hypothetical protein